MVKYKGYDIEKETRSDMAYECPLTGRYYLVPGEPRTYYHVYGPGISWLAFMPDMDSAKKLVESAILFGGKSHVEFFPGR